MTAARQDEVYGLLAEFDSAEALVLAAAEARQAGYQRLDAYSPFPIEELPRALGLARTRLPAVVLAGGIGGGLAAFGFQCWVSMSAYPLNVGGRPLFSWPAFLPVTFEMSILGAALAAIVGLLAASGLPRPHHPLFAAEPFARATQDRFFLVIEACDPQFDLDRARQFLESLPAISVTEVAQ